MVPMHTFGYPVDIEGLLSVSKDFDISMVEDAAESLGSYYFGRHTGTFGLLGTLSFKGNKIITTDGCGAMLTNDIDVARHAKHLTTTAKISHKWEFIHDEIGYNHRIPNINAALGCAQLENFQSKLQSKRNLYNSYEKAFTGVLGIKVLKESDNCKSNYWLQTLFLNNEFANKRDQIIESTNKSGYMTRPAWKLMYDLAAFSNSLSMDLSVAISLYSTIVSLPSNPNILRGKIDK